jgi:hypothetical protein
MQSGLVLVCPADAGGTEAREYSGGSAQRQAALAFDLIFPGV